MPVRPSTSKAEKKMFCKIHVQKLTGYGYRLHSRATTEKYSTIETGLRKRRLKSFRHIMRLDDTRLTKTILLQYIHYNYSTKTWTKQFKASGLKTANIKLTDTKDRNSV